MNSVYNRSQTEALTSSGNVLVSASAGSGKTTVMVEKVFRLLMEGYDISRMVVMTFSRAAAAEMKNRLVKKLYDAVRKPGEEGKRAQRQLEKFPFANICTIDGFCYVLLKKHYAVIGADPSATPMEPDESDVLWEECTEKACEAALADERFVSFADRYSSARRWDNVKKLINALKTFLAVQPDREKFAKEDFSSARLKYVTDEYKNRLESVLAEITEAAIVVRDSGMKEEEAALRRLADFISEAEKGDIFKSAFYFRPPEACRKKKDIFIAGRDSYNRVVASAKKLMEEIAEFGDVDADCNNEEDVAALFYVTNLALELYAKRKRRDGKLDFNDLSLTALEILADEKTAAEIKNSYDFIFVDEYQDTNYLHEKLLRGISRGDNVFAVGDVKQAIYKFRYAEPEIFNERMREYLKGEGKNVFLNDNYRSRRSILEFTNAVFNEVMTERYCGIDYSSNQMSAGAEYPEEDSGVEIYLIDEKKPKREVSGLYSVKAASTVEDVDTESEFIAAKIEEYVGKKKLYRPKTGESTAAAYGDIAVLTRKSAEGLRIAAALRKKNIPYTVNDVDRDSFFPRELIVDFLRLCVGEEDIPVINAMSCPVFGFTPTELMNIGKREPKTSFWEAVKRYDGDSALRKKADSFVAYVDDLREKSAYLTATELMIKVLADGLDGYFADRGDGTGERIAEFLASAEKASAKNVFDFLDWYDKAYKGERPPAAGDGVLIMTMHKSKGLEFPIVFLPFSDDYRGESQTSRDMFFADKDLGIALKYVDENSDSKDTFATKALKMKKLCDGRRELARLMYVDFTRAENKLIITGKKTKPVLSLYDANSILGFIGYAAARNPQIKFLFGDMTAGECGKEVPEEKAEEEDVDFSSLSCEYPFKEATRLPGKQTVSEIVEETEETASAKVFTYGKGGDAELGIAYHVFMQKADLSADDPVSVKGRIAELVEKNEISAETAAKLDVEKICDLLRFDIIKRAAAAKTYRELPFIFPDEREGGYTLVQGVIDLLIEEDDGLTVVDFKASGLPEEKLVEKYSTQLNLYSTAAEKIFGKRVKRKILLNILKGYRAELADN